MKPLFNQHIASRIIFFSLIYFAFALPFQLKWLSPTIGIIGMMAGWTFSFDFRVKAAKFRANKPLWAISGLYLLTLAGMLYTSNPAEGWKDVVLKIPLLFFPLVLGTVKPLSGKQLKIILLTFAFATVLSALVLFSIGFAKYLEDPSITYFFHQSFVIYPLISVHYFAMYCTFTFLILLYYFIKGYNQMKGSQKLFFVFGFMVLPMAIATGAARTQIIVFALAISAYIIWYFSKEKRWKEMIIYQLLFLLLFISSIIIIPGSHRRLQETYREWQVYQGQTDDYQTNHRVFIWKYSANVIADNFWIGTGTGSANDVLHEYLKEEKALFWMGDKPYTLGSKNYNCHNEYLQHFVTFGIAGILILLSVFIIPLFRFSNLHFLSFIFLGICFISFITESMLERQAGCLFFGFFYAILICNFWNREKRYS